jgi:NAD(P)-dependent dehydrogenase (short-subunit alcohol dehydrogenase family)
MEFVSTALLRKTQSAWSCSITDIKIRGYIDTPMLKSATSGEPSSNHEGDAPIGRMGQPHEVAALIAFLLSSDASFITGACINIDGGMSA